MRGGRRACSSRSLEPAILFNARLTAGTHYCVIDSLPPNPDGSSLRESRVRDPRSQRHVGPGALGVDSRELISKMGQNEPRVYFARLMMRRLGRDLRMGRRLSQPVSQPEEIALIVEVSDSSLRFDLTVKATLNARAGIGDYWVLDIPGWRLIVHRDPNSSGTAPSRVRRIRKDLAAGLSSDELLASESFADPAFRFETT
jgi:hypothetical protein